jgi:hypothetical protein
VERWLQVGIGAAAGWFATLHCALQTLDTARKSCHRCCCFSCYFNCQVIKRDGSRGLVPKSYVQVAEDEEDDSDALSLAGGSSAAGASGGGQADLNSFLAR